MSNTETSQREILMQVRDVVRHFAGPRTSFFGKRKMAHAVNGVSLDLFAGETLGLVGESGCGKSTIGRLILNLMAPTSGSVKFLGQEITKLDKTEWRRLRSEMQLVFQNPLGALNPRITIGAQIREPLDIHEVGTADARNARVLEMFEAVSLPPHLLERYPHQLSGGQQQRVVIARALINSPKLVVCDESVSALDVSVQAQVVNLLADLQKKLGLTYLFITHDLSVVRHISSRIAVMYLGRIVELADSGQLLENPMHPYTSALISAVPVPDPRARASRATIKGEPPNPFEPPSGCAFHARCPYADAICHAQLPEFRTINANHMVACHHAEDLLQPS
ncbi:ABC transporter, ATP-binding protein (cluster 5, nickel/peptides/opines) / ABC transporter, ATP-binding protein (cluster 5, nickel/peptides/opines) [hydrothermal vent metagenome]|uniref:ABC transporter, ATP-binding protein (Cluster 5, nickel/peptides/opines) / ABC transporter, ATP-binding protein (Cluster 5, nickel/peptides/opines) n=1 Tax=hydrothermal vent metagenome TaxID=652676 RepID=A0A3B0TQK3_9ZZZZ